MPFSAQHLKAARLHLMQSSSHLKRVIKQVGPFTARMVPLLASQQALRGCSNEQAMAELANQGMSPQEAESFLMFSLGRLDILPIHDERLARAVQLAYELPEIPDQAMLKSITDAWGPYSTVATWYLLRAMESSA